MHQPLSSYWNMQEASATLARIVGYEAEKSYRPTVVVPIVDHAGRPLLVRQGTKERNWGLVQGRIEENDADPVAACRREAGEEASITDEMIDRMYPYVLEETIDIPPRDFHTGYSKGGFYVCVGMKLRPGADVSVLTHDGLPAALLERRWCSSLDEALSILRTQPDVTALSRTTLEKVERVFIPALEGMYQPHVQERSEALDYAATPKNPILDR